MRTKHARDDARLRALGLIDANPQISRRELARELGKSLGATHYLLRAPTEAGMVRLGRFGASRRKGITPMCSPQRAYPSRPS
ncbi:winged helix-turn-helix transcriptional regulator [Erythrobacter ramosus]|uniref:winged helix-turn-helix transcriptional regulator n=1 Tax=Erythrobacter ramosus TaxID=35811 RepID=UPI003CC82F4C